MFTVKNIATGENIQVRDVKMEGGKITATWQRPEPGERFMRNNSCLVKTGETFHDDEHNVERRVLVLADGFEVVDTPVRTSKPRAPKVVAEPTTEPTAEPLPTEPAVAQMAVDIKYGLQDIDALKAELGAKYGNMGADIFEAVCKIAYATPSSVNADDVKKIFADMIQQLATTEPSKVSNIKRQAKQQQGGRKQYFCKDFKDIKQDIEDGFNVYLHGPAGSGKSHTGEQIAEQLGLTFYGQTTVQFAHDVRGYGDAGGNYQETPFFKAFSQGGLYFQDEYDRSQADAAIVLNTALANGYYDFPIVGRVEAHPDFRFMAAGNTLMKGAQDGYVTGNEQDASSRDRFATYYEVGYSHEVELNEIAKGDEELVNFVEDVRRAVKSCGIEHVVSYRATKYMEARKDGNRTKVLERCTFKALGADEIREIYGALRDKENNWAQAMKKLF